MSTPRTLLTVCFILTAALWLAAAEAPKYEFFGGYSYQRIEGDNFPAGWNASFAGYFTDTIGIVADFSGHYKSWDVTDGGETSNLDIRSHYFLAGPQFAFHQDRPVTPFVRAMAGFSYVSMKMEGPVNVSDSSTDFAFGLGGGIDVDVSDAVAVRVIQADYIRLTGDGHAGGNVLRLSFGLVFKAR